ncbi:uncharacterized protein A1O9_07476 [Exophiala aquamarina CBS 119918]|uniref:Malic acid transporter n=1 Tax=Exophiala aquamarina CBS 119918 TaxID=1182545 RepID=A0A072P7R9_9EURO|nr:uncharacterized protein A1O9_07476 [Exophiala aquamarina CBS 119918]KEF55896.1 hypothetical protein A1O9_07476 [Exophiala aquamarina CBS 119918]
MERGLKNGILFRFGDLNVLTSPSASSRPTLLGLPYRWEPIADICLFVFFMTLGILRVFMFPVIAKNVVDDFSQTSYLGAIVVAWETIVLGVVQFYSSRSSGVYAAEAMFWIAVVGSAFVAFGGIYFMYGRQKAHSLDQVNGSWFLTFIPLIVCSTLGGAEAPHLSYKNGVLVLFVSFLMWSLGVGMSFTLVPIYIWRLMSTPLPQQGVIISTFVPIGPFGMGAYSTQQLASELARRIAQHNYILTNQPQPPADSAYIATIGEAIQWAGIILALFQLAVASFFLIEGVLALCTKAPGPFNVAFWSFVFPCGVYANAWNLMSTNLRNEGLKGWAATCTVAVVLLWLFCALMSFWKGVWQGKLFFAPGLQGYLEKQEIQKRDVDPEQPSDQKRNPYGLAFHTTHTGEYLNRKARSDGSYKKVKVDN